MKNLLFLVIGFLVLGCASTVDLGTYKVDMVGQAEELEVVCKSERRATVLAKRIDKKCDTPETNGVMIMLTPDQIQCKHKFLWKEYGYLKEYESDQIKSLLEDENL